MKITLKSLFLIMMAVAIVSCQQPSGDAPTDAPTAVEEAAASAADEPEMGPDPTVVDADHYTVEFENEQVRIVRIAYAGGDESVMHYHPEAVAVFLTAQDGSFELPDGTTEEVTAEAGDVIATPAGLHKPSNLSEEPLELILVELLAGGTGAEEGVDTAEEAVDTAEEGTETADVGTGPDPTLVDSDHYTVELENDRVRVVRIVYGAGEESEMHSHPDAVGVFLVAQTASFELPDGTTEEMSAEAGQATFFPAGQHLPKNVGDDAAELILVELKGGS